MARDDFRRHGIKVPPSASEREAIDVAWDVLSLGARRVGERLTRPDDDWDPQFLIIAKHHGTLITPGTNAPHKHVFAEYVAALARRWGALAIGHLDSTWMISAENMSRERMEEAHAQMQRQDGSTEGIPERTEQVMIATYSASLWQLRFAPIIRHDNAPPTLGEWDEPYDSKDSDRAEGAMFDPMRRAVWRMG